MTHFIEGFYLFFETAATIIKAPELFMVLGMISATAVTLFVISLAILLVPPILSTLMWWRK